MTVALIQPDQRRAWLADLEAMRANAWSRNMEEARGIVDGVRRAGDGFVSELLSTYDRVDIAPEETLIEVRAGVRLSSELEAAIDSAIERIRIVHESQRPQPVVEGTSIYESVFALRRVGIYVPGGRAIYPSSLLMCAVPAIVAGVPDIVVATTPRAADSDLLHHICSKLGISSIYRGGAGSIAAMAVGTESLRRVDKIVGPGNAIVASLKLAVQGLVGIDIAAGPSEIVVIADTTSSPREVAADLMAQAEHGPDSLAIAICLDGAEESLMEALPENVDRDLLSRIAVIPSADVREASLLADQIAPEHLSIQTGQPEELANACRSAGVVYVGRYTPVALGDYVIGTNHVLPTGGTARFASALGTKDFTRRMHVVRISEKTFSELASHAAILAREEGLPLHAESLLVRLEPRS